MTGKNEKTLRKLMNRRRDLRHEAGEAGDKLRQARSDFKNDLRMESDLWPAYDTVAHYPEIVDLRPDIALLIIKNGTHHPFHKQPAWEVWQHIEANRDELKQRAKRFMLMDLIEKERLASQAESLAWEALKETPAKTPRALLYKFLGFTYRTEIAEFLASSDIEPPDLTREAWLSLIHDLYVMAGEPLPEAPEDEEEAS